MSNYRDNYLEVTPNEDSLDFSKIVQNNKCNPEVKRNENPEVPPLEFI